MSNERHNDSRITVTIDMDNLHVVYGYGQRIGNSTKFTATSLYSMQGSKDVELTDTCKAVIASRSYWLAYLALRKAWMRSCSPVVWDAMCEIVANSKRQLDNQCIYDEEMHNLSDMDTFSENDNSKVSETYAVESEMVGKSKYDYNMHEEPEKRKLALSEYHTQVSHARTKTKSTKVTHKYKMITAVVDTFEEDKNVLYPFRLSDGKVQYVTVPKKIKRNVYKRIKVDIVPWTEVRKTLYGKLTEQNKDIPESINGMDFVQDAGLALTVLAKCGLINNINDIWIHANYVYSIIRRSLYQSTNHTSAKDAERLKNGHIRKHSTAPEHITDIADIIGSRQTYQIVADILKDRLPAQASIDAIVATFWMYFVNAKTQHEIADVLHVTQQMVAKYIGYCKKYLATDDVRQMLLSA